MSERLAKLRKEYDTVAEIHEMAKWANIGPEEGLASALLILVRGIIEELEALEEVKR